MTAKELEIHDNKVARQVESACEAQLRRQIEEQRNRIEVALGYIRSGQSGIAALVLAGDQQGGGQ